MENQNRPTYSTLSQIVDNAPEVIARFDLEERHTYINAYGSTVYGIPITRVIGKTAEELGMPASHVKLTHDAFCEVFKNSHQKTVDFEFDSPNVGHRYFSCLLVPELTEEGKATSILAVTRDVTETKKAELEMRLSERKFALVFDNSPFALTIQTPPNGIIVDVNAALVKLFGFSREEMIGKTPIDLGMYVEPHERTVLLERLRNEGSVDNFSALIRDKSGQVHHIVMDFRPIGMQGKDLILGSLVDQTEHVREEERRVAAERQVRESERKFSAMFENSPFPCIFLKWPEAVFLLVNSAFEKYFGYSKSEVIGKTCEDLGMYPTAELREKTHAALRQKGTLHGYETILRDKSGRPHSIALHVNQIELDGETFAVGSLVDNEFEKTLKESKKAAEAANRAKSEFLANMSHEIRSPMNSVLGYADLLTESNVSQGERLEYAARIKTSGELLLHLLEDILDLSKVESGQLKVERRRFPTTDLILNCIHSMSILARKKGIDLRLSLGTPVPRFIESDATRFQQILLNLLSNSIKFTDQGHVEIRLRFQERIADSARPSLFIVDVEDTGIGIPPEKQEILFQAFSQADASITRRFGGTGLGLYLSRRLCTALGGNLSLAWSVPSKGSCFSFSVDAGDTSASPFLATTEEIRNPEAKIHAGPIECPRKLRVLLVEDSPDNQALMKIYLGKIKAEIEIAENGARAIDAALSSAHDIILMDIMMPVMDGLEATRRLRSNGYKKPIVALTAHALKEEVAKSLAAGCDAHLSKPVDRKELISVIDRLTKRNVHSRQTELAH